MRSPPYSIVIFRYTRTRTHTTMADLRQITFARRGYNPRVVVNRRRRSSFSCVFPIDRAHNPRINLLIGCLASMGPCCFCREIVNQGGDIMYRESQIAIYLNQKTRGI